MPKFDFSGAGLKRSTLLAVLGFPLLLTACGDGSSYLSPPTVPEFQSTPVTAATQGTMYTYQIQTLPTADAVNLALSVAPSGATLSSNTLSWTPSAAQSRVPNQFSVIATNPAGSATQSWSVTPAGTVTGTWIDTYWTSNGRVLSPFDWSKSLEGIPTALVPQPDGSFHEVQGSGNSDGTFNIPNIPAGYYWMRPAANSYWTSSSTFDFGSDISLQKTGNILTTSPTTRFDFNLLGLDPLHSGDEVEFIWEMFPPFSLPYAVGSPAGATTLNLGAVVTSNIDYSISNPAFLLQYEPETFGGLSSLTLGPTAALQNLALVNGISNTINATLVPSPQISFDLNIKGSAWTPLFTNVGPSSATLEGADLEVMTQPFVTGGNLITNFGQDIPLLVDLHPSAPPSFELMTDPSAPACGRGGPVAPGDFTFLPGEPPITADQDFGTVWYGDPFPPAWPRIFTFCQSASVPVPLPGSSTPISFRLTDSQSSSLPTAQISPPFGPVQYPMIDGTSLFTARTISATGVKLTWAAPSGTAPTGYEIVIFTSGTPLLGGVQTYLPRGSYFTAKTSASLPPLQAGQTYLFKIDAILDGAGNFETQPNRSALPTSSVSVVSAPMMVISGP
jgi:hypothetical protein